MGLYIDNEWDIELLNGILRQITEIRKHRPNLFQLLKFNVTQRNQNELNRKVRLMTYEGPDETTAKLLERNYSTWMSRPETFWEHSADYTVDPYSDPQARIVREYLRAESDSS